MLCTGCLCTAHPVSATHGSSSNTDLPSSQQWCAACVNELTLWNRPWMGVRVMGMFGIKALLLHIKNRLWNVIVEQSWTWFSCWNSVKSGSPCSCRGLGYRHNTFPQSFFADAHWFSSHLWNKIRSDTECGNVLIQSSYREWTGLCWCCYVILFLAFASIFAKSAWFLCVFLYRLQKYDLLQPLG